MASENEEWLAEFQKLSNEWQPEHKGPPVGSCQPAQIIREKYIGAQEVYERKVEIVVRNFFEIRPILGDGSCGFRAMAFGYFEALNRAQDIRKINQEINRLKAFNKAVLDENHTYSNGVYIDWADEALDLLKELAQSSFSLDGVAKLELAFNDPDRGPNILQYFRTVTGASLEGNKALYAGFMEDNQPIEEYVKSKIDLPHVEIEHPGIDALYRAVLGPAGISLEITTLNQGTGDVTKPLEWTPDGLLREDHPSLLISSRIRLLYTLPGHYDIVYKPEDMIHVPELQETLSEPKIFCINSVAHYQGSKHHLLKAETEEYSFASLFPAAERSPIDNFSSPSINQSFVHEIIEHQTNFMLPQDRHMMLSTPILPVAPVFNQQQLPWDSNIDEPITSQLDDGTEPKTAAMRAAANNAIIQKAQNSSTLALKDDFRIEYYDPKSHSNCKARRRGPKDGGSSSSSRN